MERSVVASHHVLPGRRGAARTNGEKGGKNSRFGGLPTGWERGVRTFAFCFLLLAGVPIQSRAAGVAPVVTPTAGEAVFHPGQGPVVVDAGVTIDDADSPGSINRATVRITNPIDTPHEILAITTPPDLSATYDPALGVLVVTGLASEDSYNQALQTITYENTTATTMPPRVIEYVVEDLDGNASVAATRGLQIAALLHYYTFNDNTYNDGVGGLNLTVTKKGTGGLGPPSIVLGPVGDGATTRTSVVRLLGGATNLYYLSNASTTFQTHFTIMTWAKADTQNEGNNMGIFSNGLNDTTHFQIDSNNGSYTHNGGTVGRVTYKTVVANQWTHLCETWDGANTRLYANGVLVSAKAGNAGDAFARLSIGCNRSTATGFAGNVDDLGLFDYALDGQRIAAIFVLGKFHGRNLDSPDVDPFLETFNAGPGSPLSLDGTLWGYASAATLHAGVVVGTNGGSVSAGNAYVVLDASGNGMHVVPPPQPPQFLPVSGGVSLAVGHTHTNVTLGLAVDPDGNTSALTVSTSDPSPLGIENTRIWGSGTVTADVETSGPGVVVGMSVPLVVTVSKGPLSSSDTVTLRMTAEPNSPPVFLSTGTIDGHIGETTLAPGIATVRDTDDPTTVSVVYAPAGIAASIHGVTPVDPDTISVDLEVQVGSLVTPGTYPIRLLASDGQRATIGTVSLLARGEPSSGTPSGDAIEILEATGVTGGLIVHIGCGDGSLTAALGDHSTCVVQGLDLDPSNVEQAREHIASLGLFGRVTAETWSGNGLPYVDNTVNLIVAEELAGVDMDELMRVLAPNGIAYLKYGGAWHSYVKPRPAWIDEWTHYCHDPSNNMVAHDQAVRFPRQFQWISDPRWSRHHDHKSAVNAVVSANGRIFSIIDEGSRTSIVLPIRPALIAQDAFNGAHLWKRPFEAWHTQLWPLKSGPAQLLRRLVADGDKVYVTLGNDAPVSCLNAATGETIRVYDNTRTAEEILYFNGTLYMSVNDSPSAPAYATLAAIKTAADEAWWSGQNRWITAVNAQTGALLWRVQWPVAPMSLAVSERGVFFYDGSRVVRLSLADGSQVWQSDPLPHKATILSEDGLKVVLYQDVVLYTGDESGSTDTQYGLSADTGATLWSAPHPQTGHHSPQDLMVVDGLAWSGAVANKADSGYFTGRDPWTGEAVEEFGPDVTIDWFHHRCYPGKATDNYLLMSRNGIEFLDVSNFHWTTQHWVRGTCIAGFMPCNGLIYAPPHNCACYTESKLYAYCALAPDDSGTTINRGPSLVSNPDFESGNAPWQFLSVGEGEAARHLTDNSGYVGFVGISAAGETGHIRQDLPIVDGKRYQVSFDIPYWGEQPNLVAQFLVDLGGAVQGLAVADGRVAGLVTAGSGGYLDIQPVGNPGDIALVDNINVRPMATLAESLGPRPAPAATPPTNAAAKLSPTGDPRLVVGPAYQGSLNRASESGGPDEWPTYRGDTARRGFTPATVPTNLERQWRTRIGGLLSPLTMADGKVFVSSIETHAVYALSASNGAVLWRYVTGGRVDSPPTYDGGWVYFGCADSWVYCLRASDGQLAWRYHAAPNERQMVAYDQMESVWPTPGSVLVFGGSVYCVSGRSMFVDGGLRFLKLNAQTGQQQREVILDDRDPVSGQNLQVYVTGENMTVALPDVLSYDGRYIYMRSMPFDMEGVRQYLAYHPVTDQQGEYTHLFAPGGFLSYPWPHRQYWVYGQSYASGAGGYYLAGQNAPSGQILAHDASSVYGIGRKPEYYKWTTPMEFTLFRAPIPWTVGGSPKTFSTDWTEDAPIYARAIVLTTDTLFIAGPRDVLDEEAAVDNLLDPVIQTQLLEQEAALTNQRGAALMAVSNANGAILKQYDLNYPPVWDGMASAYGSLFLATTDGEVIRMRPTAPRTAVRSWGRY